MVSIRLICILTVQEIHPSASREIPDLKAHTSSPASKLFQIRLKQNQTKERAQTSAKAADPTKAPMLSW